ncbi:MAG: adenosylmethionine--8-amino-7-oxononanoate transaminase, partial [Deltaproteobacteria bacterium]
REGESRRGAQGARRSRVDGRVLEAWDDAHLWHPFTPHAVYRDEQPLLIERGEGHDLIDVDGNRYLDGVASIWCNTFGHRHDKIDAAIRAQLDRIAHATLLGHATVPSVQLAKRLADLAPDPLTKVFYSDNGSTAVEIALKMTYQYWQQVGETKRTRFLAFDAAYNGDTIGAVSVGGIDLFHRIFHPMLFDVLRAPSPYGQPEASLTALAELFDRHEGEIGALVIEPGFQGAGGILPLPNGFLAEAVQIAKNHGTLVVFDEVAVGMGRSGAMFCCEREGVTPDFLCIAKGLTAGYLPLAATLTTQTVFDAFVAPPGDKKTFFHGHTYTGNALGCAAALATLDVFEQEGVLDALPAKVEHLASAARRLAGKPGVQDVRSYGLAAGIELGRPDGPFDPNDRTGIRVCLRARDKGVFLRPLGDVLVIMPPLTVSTEEIDRIVDAIAYGLESVEDGG